MERNVSGKRATARRVAVRRAESQSAADAGASHAVALDDTNGFVTLLRELGGDRLRAAAAIRLGFPAVLIRDAGAFFAVPAARIRSIIRLPETTSHTLMRRGALLDAGASERIWRLADLYTMARDVFADDEAARVWLRTPNRAFRDVAPMDYLDTEPGASSVRQVLNAIASGGAA